MPTRAIALVAEMHLLPERHRPRLVAVRIASVFPTLTTETTRAGIHSESAPVMGLRATGDSTRLNISSRWIFRTRRRSRRWNRRTRRFGFFMGYFL